MIPKLSRPHGGAWIETRGRARVTAPDRRALTGARGLKLHSESASLKPVCVAPSRGAWIETVADREHTSSPEVAPSRGARGLKLKHLFWGKRALRRALTGARGLKL